MEQYLLEKNLIFFNPNISGTVFVHPSKHPIDIDQLLRLQESLVQKTNKPVIYIEDRRSEKRGRRPIQNILSQIYLRNSQSIKKKQMFDNFYM